MKKRRISFVGVSFVALFALVIVFLLRLSLHRPTEVVLPETDSAGSGGDVVSDVPQESIRRVEVTPETVQLVIERLERPENYSRTVVLERYWSGGSGQSNAQVAVSDGWTRLDATGNGDTRHVITGGDHSWVWYGDDKAYYSGASALSADEEQSIPTYEDILRLDRSAIAVADYRTLDTTNCIYVETHPDEGGYVARYWISVENGLLAAAERVQGESAVYRMAGLSYESGTASAEAFTLPDGTVLHDPNTENEG